jgi:hypothetical protein
MRNLCLVFLGTLILNGCSPIHTPPSIHAENQQLEDYVNRYCSYTGNMGIGIDASDTYEYAFRQRLAKSKDPELLRLFVLWHLYDEVQNAIEQLDLRTVRIGQNLWRPMTPMEYETERLRILGELENLSQFDASNPQGFIADLRKALIDAPDNHKWQAAPGR